MNVFEGKEEKSEYDGKSNEKWRMHLYSKPGEGHHHQWRGRPFQVSFMVEGTKKNESYLAHEILPQILISIS